MVDCAGVRIIVLGIAIFVFFFQAEDGIRDLYVTGVQTCALPISPCKARATVRSSSSPAAWPCVSLTPLKSSRSEERRVGKECRSRWSADHLKKKKMKEETEYERSLQ